MVRFTGGRPDAVAATGEAVTRLRRAGAVRLVGAMGLSELECGHSMPGGAAFSVEPRHPGRSLHVAANRPRRRGEGRRHRAVAPGPPAVPAPPDVL